MLTDVEGIKVGHWTDLEGITGCTVVLTPEGTVGSCEYRGGGPGDRQWVLLQPEQRPDRVHGIALSGGSAFGLAVADGVTRWLAERGIGWPIGDLGVRVPLVPAAILLDLGIGDPTAWPGPEHGIAACEAAVDGPFATGNVGAGTGCTAGKYIGLEWAMKSGIGTSTIRQGDLVVSALVAANPVGDVLDETGGVLAGNRAPVGTPSRWIAPGQSTVLGIVATNALLEKSEAFLMARAGQDGVATVVRPAHTRYDGDVIFGLATRQVSVSVDQVIPLASEVVAAAIRQAVRAAKGAGGYPGLAD